MAAAQGHRSMLVGAAGDLTQLTSMRYLAPILRKLRFHQAWRGAVKASMNDVYQIGVSPTRIFGRNLYEAFLPSKLRLGIADFRRRRSGMPDSMINKDFAKRIRVEDRYFVLKSEAGLAAQRFGSDAGEQALTEHFTSALTGFGRMAARFGVESSDPWADRRVIELFLDLPLKWKTHEGWTKYITRSAFENDLPSSVIWRRDKQHLGAQLVARLMRASGPWLDEAFGPGLQFAEPFMDTNLLKSKYKQFRSENEGSLKLAVDLAGWAALIFWLERVNSLRLRTD
jgi:asparagine synthase (glutamine-hydrolysing)